MKRPVMVIRLLVCGLCIRDGVPPEERFRASDSPLGEVSMRQHKLDEHTEVEP